MRQCARSEIDRGVSAHLRGEDRGLADGIQVRSVAICNTWSVEPKVEDDVNLPTPQQKTMCGRY